MDKKLVAKELIKIAKSLTADQDDKDYRALVDLMWKLKYELEQIEVKFSDVKTGCDGLDMFQRNFNFSLEHSESLKNHPKYNEIKKQLDEIFKGSVSKLNGELKKVEENFSDVANDILKLKKILY